MLESESRAELQEEDDAVDSMTGKSKTGRRPRGEDERE